MTYYKIILTIIIFAFATSKAISSNIPQKCPDYIGYGLYECDYKSNYNNLTTCAFSPPIDGLVKINHL